MTPDGPLEQNLKAAEAARNISLDDAIAFLSHYLIADNNKKYTGSVLAIAKAVKALQPCEHEWYPSTTSCKTCDKCGAAGFR